MVKLALKGKEVLDVLLAEEIHSTFVILYEQSLGDLIPASLTLVHLWKAISLADLSV